MGCRRPDDDDADADADGDGDGDGTRERDGMGCPWIAEEMGRKSQSGEWMLLQAAS